MAKKKSNILSYSQYQKEYGKVGNGNTITYDQWQEENAQRQRQAQINEAVNKKNAELRKRQQMALSSAITEATRKKAQELKYSPAGDQSHLVYAAKAMANTPGAMERERERERQANQKQTEVWKNTAKDAKYSPDGVDRSYQAYAAKQINDSRGSLKDKAKQLNDFFSNLPENKRKQRAESVLTGDVEHSAWLGSMPEETKQMLKGKTSHEIIKDMDELRKSGYWDNTDDVNMWTSGKRTAQRAAWNAEAEGYRQQIENLNRQIEDSEASGNRWDALLDLYTSPEVENERAIIYNEGYTDAQKQKARDTLNILLNKNAGIGSQSATDRAKNFLRYNIDNMTTRRDMMNMDNMRRMAYDAMNGDGAYEQATAGMDRKQKQAMDDRINEALDYVADPNGKLGVQKRTAEMQLSNTQDALKRLDAAEKREAEYDTFMAGRDYADTEYHPENNVYHQIINSDDQTDDSFGGKSYNIRPVDVIYSVLGGENGISNYDITDSNYGKAALMDDEPGENGYSEQDIFLSYYNAGLYDEALAFYKGLEPTLNQRYSYFEKIKLEDQATRLPVLSSIATAAATPLQTAEFIINLPGQIKALLTGEDNGTTDPYSNNYAITRYKGITRNRIATALGNDWGWAYQGLMSGIDSGINVAIGKGLGLTGDALQYGVLGLFGTQAFETSLQNNMESGSNNFAYDWMEAFIDAAIETATEVWSVENWLGDPTNLLKYVAKIGISEPSEEIVGAIVEPYVKEMLGHKNQWQERAKQILGAGGYQDGNGKWVKVTDADSATRQAMREWNHEIRMSAQSALLSVGPGAAYGTAQIATQTMQTGNQIQQNAGMQQVLEAAMGLDETTTANQTAQGMMQRAEAGKNNSAYKIGQLAQDIMREGQEQGQQKVHETTVNFVNEQLKELNIDDEEMTGIIVKAIEAENGIDGLTKEERQKLNGNHDALNLYAQLRYASPTSNELRGRQNEATEGEVNAIKSVADVLTKKKTMPKGDGIHLASVEDVKNAKGQQVQGARGLIVDGTHGKLDGIRIVKDADGKYSTKILATVDGKQQEVSSSSILPTDYQTARIIQDAVSNPEFYSEKYTGALIDAQEKGQIKNIDQALKEARQIRMYAYAGFAMPVTGLNYQLAQGIYTDSATEHAENRKNDLAGNNKAATGKATYKGAEYGTEGWNTIIKNLDKNLRNKMDAIAAIAHKAGIEVDFTELDDDKTYGWQQGKKIGINIEGMNYGLIDGQKTQARHDIMVTFGHEMTHWLQSNSMKGYNRLERFVMQQYAKDNGTDTLMKRLDHHMQDNGYNLEGAISEVVADSCDQILNNEEVQQEIAQNDKGLYGEIKNFVKDLVDRIRKATIGMTESASRDARAVVKGVNEISRLWLGAYNEALSGKLQQDDEQQKPIQPARMSKAEITQIDKEYMAAVESGNTEEQQRLVDESAKTNKYTDRAYHGTEFFGFTKIDMDASQNAVFVAYDKDLAATYAPTTEIKKISERVGEPTNIYKLNDDDLIDYFNKLYNNKFAETISMKKVENGAENGKAMDKFEYVYKDKIWNQTTTVHLYRFELMEWLKRAASPNGEYIGIYDLYTKPGKQLVVDAKHRNWNDIPFDLRHTPDNVIDGRYEIDPYGEMQENMDTLGLDYSDMNMSVKTRDIAEWAKKWGFDSVRINNVRDNGGRNSERGYEYSEGDIGIFFNPNDVKSADAITYDDAGNVIPPSERFNDQKTDIRWSKADTESERLFNEMNTAREREQTARAKLSEIDGDVKAWVDKVSAALGTENEEKVMAEYKKWEDETYKPLSREMDEARQQVQDLNKKWNEYIENRDVTAEKEAIEKSGLSEEDYRRKQAVKEFGYTGDYREAGYMLPNGRLLNFTGEKGMHRGKRGQDHRNISTVYASTDMQGGKAMYDFMRNGNIRVIAETPGIDIIKEPTASQYAQIRDMVRRFAGEEYFNVDLTDEKGFTIDSIEYDGRVNADKVVNDIKHYFRTGEVPQQSTVSQFHFSKAEIDNRYQQAVESGNTAEQQELVDQAAEAAGYTMKVYHGTPTGGFTQFRDWSYFTENKAYADRYNHASASSIRAYAVDETQPMTYELYMNPGRVFDTRDPETAELFEQARQEYGLTELQEDGLPDWTDGRDLIEYIEENDLPYDTIILNEGADGGYGQPVVSRGVSYVTRSNLIKSAEPITRDDAGNIIPPSERFNDQKTDIRWSKQDETSIDAGIWLANQTPSSFITKDEEALWQEYRGLRISMSLNLKKMLDYRNRIKQLENKEALTEEELTELINNRERLEREQEKQTELENQMHQVTSSDGYAGLMYRMSSVLKEFAQGKTSDQVKATVENMLEEVKAAQAEIAQRAEELKKLEETQAVKAMKSFLGKTSLDQQAAMLRKQYNSTMNKQEIQDRLAGMALKLATGKDIQAEAEGLAADLVAKIRGEKNENLEYLRGMTFIIGKNTLNELKAENSSLKELRDKIFGSGVKLKVSTTDGKSRLVEQWNELRDKNKSLKEIDGKQDIDVLHAIVDEISDMLESSSGAQQYEVNMDEAVAICYGAAASVTTYLVKDPTARAQIKELMGQIKDLSRQTGSIAESLERMDERMQQVVSAGYRASDWAGILKHDVSSAIDYYNKVARLAAQEERTRVKKDIINKLKSENTKKLLQQRDEYEQLLKDNREARETEEENLKLRRKINTNISRLKTKLTAETDTKNVPEEAKGLARFLCEKLVGHDMTDGLRKVLFADKKQLQDFKARLDRMNKQFGRFDADNDLNWLTITYYDGSTDTEMKDRVIDDLRKIDNGLLMYWTAEGNKLNTLKDRRAALDEISKAVSEITNVINARGKAFILGKRYEIAELAENMESEMSKSRFKGERVGFGSKARTGIVNAIGYGNLTPEYFFKMLRNSTLNTLHNGFHDAENRSGLLAAEAQKKIAQIAGETGYGTWNGKEKHQVQVNGGTVDMTTEQIMALRAVWMREKNALRPEETAHLLRGGFVLALDDETKGKPGRVKREQRPVRMTKELLENLDSYLTPEQIRYADSIVGYMSDEIADIGNQTSMENFGIKKFTEEWYFPIKSWGGVLNQASNKGVNKQNDNRAGRQSFLKRVTAGAQNAVEISDFTPTAMKHIVGMITFNTVFPAVENLNKVLNYQLEYDSDNKVYDEEGNILEDNSYKRSVRAAFQEAYGKSAADYLAQFMDDINGGTAQGTGNTAYDKLLSAFKKNAVAGSLSVAAQQPLSIIRASMMINPKYLAQGMTSGYLKGAYEELKKYSGVAVLKDMGKFDMNYGRSMIDYITPETKEGKAKAAYDWVSDKATILPQKMDAWAWTRMWVAVKAEQHAMHKDMDVNSEEFLQKCADRFNDVMRRTQVYDSVLVKSQNMRSNHWYMKTITSFMAEPTLSLNVLADAMRNIKEKGGKKNAAKALATFVLSAAAQAAAKALFSTGRSPDKKKTEEENYLYRLSYNLIGELNPLGLIPGYSQLIDTLQNGELTDNSMSVIAKAKDAFNNLAGLFTNTTDKNWYRKTEDSIGQLLQLATDIPAKNFMRDFRAMVNLFSGGRAQGLTGGTYAQRDTSGAVLKYQLKDLVATEDIIGLINAELGAAGYETSTAAYVQRIYQANKAGKKGLAQEMTDYLTLGKGKSEKSLNTDLNKLTKEDDSLSSEKKKEMLTEHGYGSMSSWVLDEYRNSKINRTTAEKMYREERPDATDKQIAEALDKIEYEKKTGKKVDNYSNYTPLYDAMDANKSDDIKAAAKKMLDIGYQVKDIKSQITQKYKSQYLKGSTEDKRRILDAIEKAYKALGLTAKDADKIVNGWKEKNDKKK